MTAEKDKIGLIPLNIGILEIIVSLLIIQTGYTSWLSYFNLLQGLILINLAVIVFNLK